MRVHLASVRIDRVKNKEYGDADTFDAAFSEIVSDGRVTGVDGNTCYTSTRTR